MYWITDCEHRPRYRYILKSQNWKVCFLCGLRVTFVWKRLDASSMSLLLKSTQMEHNFSAYTHKISNDYSLHTSLAMASYNDNNESRLTRTRQVPCTKSVCSSAKQKFCEHTYYWYHNHWICSKIFMYNNRHARTDKQNTKSYINKFLLANVIFSLFHFVIINIWLCKLNTRINAVKLLGSDIL